MRFPTLQSVFDHVARHLLQQGDRSRLRGRPDRCAYRGADGRACAIGCLLADDSYSAGLEGATLSEEIMQHVLYESGVNMDDPQMEPLLNELQIVHDYDEVADWKSHLAAVARIFHLSEAVLA